MFELKENITGQKAIYKTLLNIEKQDNVLVFEFYASHCSFYSASNKFNDPIYNGDVVEVFIKTKENNHYLEVELAPNGTLFIGDIFNDGKSRVLTMLENKGIIAETKKNNRDLMAKLIIPYKKYNIPEDIEFNAFRIDTDDGKVNAHLFALNPTLCKTFHKPEAFVNLKNYK